MRFLEVVLGCGATLDVSMAITLNRAAHEAVYGRRLSQLQFLHKKGQYVPGHGQVIHLDHRT